MGTGSALPKKLSRLDESRVPKVEICGNGNLKKLAPKGEDEKAVEKALVLIAAGAEDEELGESSF
jgi:hypothetical protein